MLMRWLRNMANSLTLRCEEEFLVTRSLRLTQTDEKYTVFSRVATGADTSAQRARVASVQEASRGLRRKPKSNAGDKSSVDT